MVLGDFPVVAILDAFTATYIVIIRGDSKNSFGRNWLMVN